MNLVPGTSYVIAGVPATLFRLSRLKTAFAYDTHTKYVCKSYKYQGYVCRVADENGNRSAITGKDKTSSVLTGKGKHGHRLGNR